MFEESEDSFSENEEESFENEDDYINSDLENEDNLDEFDLTDPSDGKNKPKHSHKQAYVSYLKSMKCQELAEVIGTDVNPEFELFEIKVDEFENDSNQVVDFQKV